MAALEINNYTSYTTGNLAVDLMRHVKVSGVIINPNWNKTILTEKGKPHRLAILLYGEIVSWYQPTPIYNNNGELTGYKKKFNAELLQLSYSHLADKYNETKQTITRAIVRLEELGLITRVFKTLFINGKKFSNVLYIDMHVSKLVEITVNPVRRTSTPSSAPSACSNDNLITNEDRGIIRNDETNTSTTTVTKDKTVKNQKRLEIIKNALNELPNFTPTFANTSAVYTLVRSVPTTDLEHYMNCLLARVIVKQDGVKCMANYIKGVIAHDIIENKIVDFTCKKKHKNTINNKKKNNLVNFSHREYDFDKLETQLLQCKR